MKWLFKHRLHNLSIFDMSMNTLTATLAALLSWWWLLLVIPTLMLSLWGERRFL